MVSYICPVTPGLWGADILLWLLWVGTHVVFRNIEIIIKNLKIVRMLVKDMENLYTYLKTHIMHINI